MKHIINNNWILVNMKNEGFPEEVENYVVGGGVLLSYIKHIYTQNKEHL